MQNHLLKIEQFITDLDSDAKNALDKFSIRRIFKKGEFLLKQEEVCRESYLLLNGIARKFYLTVDGREITTEFYFTNDLAVSLKSYAWQSPSNEYIVALEETEVLAMDYHAFQTIKLDFKELIELDLMMTEYHAIWLEERLHEFHTLDATQRYQLLVEKSPHFVQNLNLTYIASYLGISLETLSRIRAKKKTI